MSDILQQMKDQAIAAIPHVTKHMERDVWKQQPFLRMKQDWVGALEMIDPDTFFTVSGKKGFGIGEMLVNQLIILAYKQGQINGKDSAYNAGYTAARREIAEKLGFIDDSEG